MSNQNKKRVKEPDSIDQSFDVLRDPCRRSLCRYVMQTETAVITHEEVVDRVSTSIETTLDRTAVATELRHIHLPKLDEAGLIEYDRESGAVHVDRATTEACLEQVRATVAELQGTQLDR
ncbi:DUF7344 domain-containing protein [Natrinema longum]|uniref:DUF7344 domain-containing protein n=1 Tax=Natrinema longum TaxID=370324 RepID=A0A8A2U6T2_9EURY|nr:hypothetical protein [Natrinema longum]MBZ6494330.1 hypothetical protein [Natrinema longum]QSW84347.1 hypothetical protein J0X27_12910 [Natrinema longum]